MLKLILNLINQLLFYFYFKLIILMNYFYKFLYALYTFFLLLWDSFMECFNSFLLNTFDLIVFCLNILLELLIAMLLASSIILEEELFKCKFSLFDIMVHPAYLYLQLLHYCCCFLYAFFTFCINNPTNWLYVLIGCWFFASLGRNFSIFVVLPLIDFLPIFYRSDFFIDWVLINMLYIYKYLLSCRFSYLIFKMHDYCVVIFNKLFKNYFYLKLFLIFLLILYLI